MDSLSVQEMQDLQKELHRVYEDDWGELGPDVAMESLLWTIGEVGEVIDVIKKEGCDAIMNDGAVRSHFTEEVCDVLMHLTDFSSAWASPPRRSARASGPSRNGIWNAGNNFKRSICVWTKPTFSADGNRKATA